MKSRKPTVVQGYVCGNRGNRSLGVYIERSCVECALSSAGLRVDDRVVVKVRQGAVKSEITGIVSRFSTGRRDICYDANSLKALDGFDLFEPVQYWFRKAG